MLKLCAPSICKPPNVWKKIILFTPEKSGEAINKKLPADVFIPNLRKINEKTYVQINFQFY